jgi:hypothetical protein
MALETASVIPVTGTSHDLSTDDDDDDSVITTCHSTNFHKLSYKLIIATPKYFTPSSWRYF